MSHQDQTLRKTEDRLDGLSVWAGLGTPRGATSPAREFGVPAKTVGVLLSQLHIMCAVFLR